MLLPLALELDELEELDELWCDDELDELELDDQWLSS